VPVLIVTEVKYLQEVGSRAGQKVSCGGDLHRAERAENFLLPGVEYGLEEDA
jgi:hypothetical protein